MSLQWVNPGRRAAKWRSEITGFGDCCACGSVVPPGRDGAVIKLGDFGLSRSFSSQVCLLEGGGVCHQRRWSCSAAVVLAVVLAVFKFALWLCVCVCLCLSLWMVERAVRGVEHTSWSGFHAHGMPAYARVIRVARRQT